ncbi:NAD(P)-dependent dehydrogenase (short-subunit alcohol dehydrogenase family) [Crossiella equi]|uniref:NAD(P)-dependent dehydrogenase (Short-subunit alcohol dehydrogenase family) n=1 Tax=Crossiella equi TaxID=130796 RepID=A0ABS5ARK4_9PSEU|nr:SDR family NAD(P)-dependent oxidoreductase [Crossiella equi]MBP2478330.1 NAD(P)-dependent dehydrogenase (short-subunit alcohol dehydrogenase family) [Crossiella equi]
MGTTVISGGTDGLGRALARHLLDAGGTVVVIGRDHRKFAGLAHDRAHFVQADLTLLRDNDRVVAEIAEAHPRVDALVLTAAHVVTRRTLTPEGIEHNLALYALSRHTLAEGLLPQLRRAPHPVVLNTAVPGAPRTAMHWHDPTLAERYSWRAANLQSRRANLLSALALTAREPRLGYVLYNPLFVRGSLSGDLSRTRRALTTLLFRLAPTPERSLSPILHLLTTPPRDRVTAYTKAKRLPLDLTPEDHTEARRLEALVAELRARL